MAQAGSTRGYFVVWTQNDFIVELIFKQYMVKALLNVEPLTYFGKC